MNKEFVGKGLWGFAFCILKGEESFRTYRWGRIYGEGQRCSLGRSEKLGKDALWGRKYDTFPVWGRIAFHFRGKKAWLLPHVVMDSHIFRRKEAINPSPCREGFMGKDSCALMGRNLISFPLWWEGCVGNDSCTFKEEESLTPHVGKDLWGGIAMHLERKRKLDSFPM